MDLGIKAGYKSRIKPQYYTDEAAGIVWQPDVYRAAIALAKRHNIKTIVDIGSGNGLKLVEDEEHFKYIFVDFGDNLKVIRENMKEPKKHVFIEQNFEKGFPNLSKKITAKSIVICSDVIEHIVDPTKLAKGLAALTRAAEFVFISTPDRLRTRGVYEYGPPANLTHVREWSLEELDWFMHKQGAEHLIGGYTRSNDIENNRNTIILIGGAFVNEIMTTKYSRNVDMYTPASKNLQHYFDLYYLQKNLKSDTSKKLTQIKLPQEGFLDSPSVDIPLNKLMNHALANGYTHLSVDTYKFTGGVKAYDNMAVNYRQHGKLLQYAGSKTLQIGQDKTRLYPISLLFVVPTKKTPFRRRAQKAYRWWPPER